MSTDETLAVFVGLVIGAGLIVVVGLGLWAREHIRTRRLGRAESVASDFIKAASKKAAL